MAGPSDTSPEAQRVLTESYRAMSPHRKVRLIGREFALARSLHESGFARRHPSATRGEARASWGAALLGPDLWGQIERPISVDENIENADVVGSVVGAFEAMGVPYAIGGSWASSVHGEPRMTRDADVSAGSFPGCEAEFVGRFGPEYYVSPDAVREANARHSTFNVIHVPTAFKVDVFVVRPVGFEGSMLRRRWPGPLAGSSEGPAYWVSAEDIILLKLRWYRLGNEVSDRQWSDVLGVLRTQAGRLDEGYLDRWAAELGVSDLLARARGDAAPAA